MPHNDPTDFISIQQCAFNDATLLRAFPQCEDPPFGFLLAVAHSGLRFTYGTDDLKAQFAAVIFTISFLYIGFTSHFFSICNLFYDLWVIFSCYFPYSISEITI